MNRDLKELKDLSKKGGQLDIQDGLSIDEYRILRCSDDAVADAYFIGVSLGYAQAKNESK